MEVYLNCFHWRVLKIALVHFIVAANRGWVMDGSGRVFSEEELSWNRRGGGGNMRMNLKKSLGLIIFRKFYLIIIWTMTKYKRGRMWNSCIIGKHNWSVQTEESNSLTGKSFLESGKIKQLSKEFDLMGNKTLNTPSASFPNECYSRLWLPYLPSHHPDYRSRVFRQNILRLQQLLHNPILMKKSIVCTRFSDMNY